jgi:hypothetical protein
MKANIAGVILTMAGALWRYMYRSSSTKHPLTSVGEQRGKRMDRSICADPSSSSAPRLAISA